MKKSLALCSILVSISACASPLANAEEGSPNPTAVAATTGQADKENLLKVYGCPNAFEGIPLCMQIIWQDENGKTATGPMRWSKPGDRTQKAKLLFWSAKDGWPIDPRVEFPEVKFIKMKLFMPTMGHGTMGTNPTVEEIKERVGQFQVGNIRFVMGATDVHPWDVRIQLKKTHDDADFDEPNDGENVFKQKILQFTSIDVFL